MDVTITNLWLSYGEAPAVKNLSLTIADGTSTVLLGHSGCGKTSTMMCIAGLEEPSGGSIAIGGRVVFDHAGGRSVPPHRRNVGMVFQSYAIWPHRTVMENVTFPLRMKKVGRADAERKAQEVLELVGLAGYARRGASLLSGGQMQRVALARSLAMEPSVLLLDEPLSNLDARLRDDLRVELRRIQQTLGLTCLYVTHDQQEALALADRIAIMEDGAITQIGTPQEIYSRPATASVARFLGITNVFAVAEDATAPTLRLDGHDVRMTTSAASVDPGQPLSVGVRPEDVVLTTSARGAVNEWPGTVEVTVFQGASVRYSVKLDAGPRLDVVSGAQHAPGVKPQDRVWARVAVDDVKVLPAA